MQEAQIEGAEESVLAEARLLRSRTLGINIYLESFDLKLVQNDFRIRCLLRWFFQLKFLP